jgi:hypothetical protein
VLLALLQLDDQEDKENIMAIAPNFTTGLLGYDPLEQQRQQQKLWAGMYGQASSPYEKIGIGLGQLGGALIGGLMGDSPQQKKEKAVAEVKQQADAQFTPGSAEYFRFVAENLPAEYADSRAYAAQEAMKAQAAADKMYLDRVKTVTENPAQMGIVSAPISAQVQSQIARMSVGGQPLNEKQIAELQASPQYQQLVGLTSAQAAGVEKQAPATPEFVNKELLAQAIQDSSGNVREGTILYNQRRLAEKEKVAKAGVAPAPGNVPLTVLKQAQDIVNEYTSKPKLALDNIGRIAVIGEQVKKNPTVLPQFRRELVKLAGDSQIGQNEVKAILGSEGFASDVINGVNNFLEGKPTNVKIDNVLAGVKALEMYTAKQYDTGRQKAKTVLDQGNIAPETRDAILPPAYKMPIPAPKVGTVKGGFRFKGGNPADEKNWEAVK